MGWVMTKTRKEIYFLSGLWFSLLVLLLPNSGLASGEVLTSSIGGYQVNLAFMEPVKVGSVPVRIKIIDGEGTPISDAQVEIKGMQGMSDMDMSAMGHDMSSMAVVPTVVLNKELLSKTGSYYGLIPFSTDGDWVLNTHFNINGQSMTVDFPVEVARNSTALLVLLGFAGLNAFIIWIASVAKRNAISA
jgi:hypothetical protein